MNQATEYKAPNVAVEIAGKFVLDLVDAEVSTSRIHPVDLAKVTLRAPGLDVAVDDELFLYMGMDSDQTVVFGGHVSDVADEAQIVISAVDLVAKLKTVTVSKCFVDCTPAVVGRYIFDLAGVTAIVPSDGPAKHSFLVPGINGLDAMKLIESAWSLGWDLFAEPEGFLYWGPTDKSLRSGQKDAYVFERGHNLLTLEPGADVIKLTATFCPFVRHSEEIIIHDPVLLGSAVFARVERARHRYAELLTEVECRLIA
jgi:hypothetical protein